MTLSLLLNATQQIYAIDLPPAEDAQQAIGIKKLTLRIPTAVEPKAGVIDGPYNAKSDTGNVLSESTKHSLAKSPFAKVAGWENHANHVASIIHMGNPTAELRVINVLKETLEGAIYAAIKSKVNFINLSLKPGGISEDLKKAFYAARDKGIGIIMAAGNDEEVIGSTPYSRSLADLVNRMQGSMLLVTATEGTDGEETLASFSNKAGAAYNYTIAAPGTHIWAYGDSNKLVNMSGTSMAAPVVTASASSLKAAYPDLSSKDILLAIRDSARKITVTKVKFDPESFGNGVLDCAGALKKAREINKLRSSKADKAAQK